MTFCRKEIEVDKMSGDIQSDFSFKKQLDSLRSHLLIFYF